MGWRISYESSASSYELEFTVREEIITYLIENVLNTEENLDIKQLAEEELDYSVEWGGEKEFKNYFKKINGWYCGYILCPDTPNFILLKMSKAFYRIFEFLQMTQKNNLKYNYLTVSYEHDYGKLCFFIDSEKNCVEIYSFDDDSIPHRTTDYKLIFDLVSDKYDTDIYEKECSHRYSENGIILFDVSLKP